MKIKVFSKTQYQTFPEVDGMIEITDEQYAGLQAGTHRFNDSLTAVEAISQAELDAKKKAEEKAKVIAEEIRSIESRISALKAKLSATDYKAIKYAEGFITADEYAIDRQQRQAWRDEINELEADIQALNE